MPYESSGEIVLGQVELDDQCKAVYQINTGVRRYVGAASAAKVHQYALEGERHIDKNNPGRIYFHIRGRQPNAVTLYLRAEKFSTLHYSEMGKHNHRLTLDRDILTLGPSPATSLESHEHDLVHIDNSGGPMLTDEENGGAGHLHDLTTRIKGKHSYETDGWIHPAVSYPVNPGGERVASEPAESHGRDDFRISPST